MTQRLVELSRRSGKSCCGAFCRQVHRRRSRHALFRSIVSLSVFTVTVDSLVLSCSDDVRCNEWVSARDALNCSEHAGFLGLHCPLLCGTCDKHAEFRRCKKDAGAQLATTTTEVSDLARATVEQFERMYADQVAVLHAPLPMLVQLDNFLSTSEAAAVVAVAESFGFQDGARYIDGAAGLRTSATAFCRGECEWSPAIMALTSRISFALGIPCSHFEPVQFVRYGAGEHYAEHSDFIDEDAKAPWGPRLFTFFVYLSEGFGGGETEFPRLGARVSPRTGRAAVWSDSFGFMGGKSGKMNWLPDGRANHAALPVATSPPDAPYKYACNVWVHNGDVRHFERYRGSCGGARAGAGAPERSERSEGVEALLGSAEDTFEL